MERMPLSPTNEHAIAAFPYLTIRHFVPCQIIYGYYGIKGRELISYTVYYSLPAIVQYTYMYINMYKAAS